MKTTIVSALLILLSANSLWAIAEIRFGAYDPATSTFDVLLLDAPTAAAFSFDIDGATVSTAVAGDYVQSAGWLFVVGPGGVASFNFAASLGSDNVRFARVTVTGITGPMCIYDVVLGDLTGANLPFTIGPCIPNSNCDASLAPTDLSAAMLPGSTNWELSWATTANSQGCRIAGRPLGAASEAFKIAPGFQVSSVVLPGSVLSPGTTYEFRVQCTCNISPLAPTPFSSYATFSVPAPRVLEKSPKVVPIERF